MATRYVRIKCQPKARANKDSYDFAFDAVIEDDLLVSLPWYGVATRGKIELYPFRLETDGRINYGTGYDDDDRYWVTKLFERVIRVGEAFSVRGTHTQDAEILYVIAELNQIKAAHGDAEMTSL